MIRGVATRRLGTIRRAATDENGNTGMGCNIRGRNCMLYLLLYLEFNLIIYAHVYIYVFIYITYIIWINEIFTHLIIKQIMKIHNNINVKM